MTSRDLPEDLVVEILSRVPAVSLARLRSTCKEWNAMIKDGRVLAKKHFTNAPKHSLVLLLIDFRIYLMSVNLHGIHNNVTPSVKVTWRFSLKDPLSNNSLEEVDIRYVFDHCNGLLLCHTKDNRLVVWNPFSGETRWIQHKYSNIRFHLYTLGYDNKSSCYKILSMDDVFSGGSKFQTECEIYDFTSDSWRGVGVTTDCFLEYTCTSRGVYMNGNTYWLATHQNYANYFLLSFDFSTERFQRFSLKWGDAHWDTSVALSVTREGQQLCMLASSVNEDLVTNVWIATKSENTGEMSWSKFFTVLRNEITYDITYDSTYRGQFRGGVSFLADLQEKKVIVSCNHPMPRFYKEIIHIVGEDIYVTLDHHGVQPTYKSPNPLLLLSYVPSLVQIQQGI